jgi:gas vesicle protein
MAKMKLLRKIALGAALAGAAGYLAGLLTAPKSGRAIRKDISDAAGSNLSDIEKQVKELQSELGDLLDSTKAHSGEYSGKAQDELKNLLGKAKDSKEKMRKVITAVRDGDETNDKDLKKAMTDARHAIKHIKDFIQK